MKNIVSYGENLMKEILDVKYGGDKKIDNYRPDWLKNSFTGNNLELDRFYPEINTAYEFNGEYHYNSFTRDRDSFKKTCCNKNKVRLLTINPNGLFALVDQCVSNKKLKTFFFSKISKYLKQQSIKHPSSRSMHKTITRLRKMGMKMNIWKQHPANGPVITFKYLKNKL